MTHKDNMDTNKKRTSSDVAHVVAAYAQRSDVSIDDILTLATRLMPVFEGADTTIPAPAETTTAPIQSVTPAISLDKAVTDEKVYCLCCGRGFTMLKRHLKAEHGLTEDEYRQMFNLAEDFPLVAPNYSKRKANYAKEVGLGKYARETGQEEAARAT